jgi:hypothetical protein
MDCSNPRHLKKSKDATTGVEKKQLLTLCLSCYNLDLHTGAKGDLVREQARDRYHNDYKLDEEKAEKIREKSRARRKAKSEQQANETLPVLDRLPPKTSKFVSEVVAEVCKALASYNIRYKAEFNYVGHKLYPRTANIIEWGLRADFLLEVDLKGKDNPLTMVIEAQG